jgi:N-hydroxyarylamine O-acetyltransferase
VEDGEFMDRQTYLTRIGYEGSLTPTASTLHDLHLVHLRSVPFENLDIQLGNPIVLNLADLYEKIVRRRRGGFCYEQNGFFAWLLGELGFEVTLLSARVANSEGRFGQEFDHLTLQVLCPADPVLPSIPWLADVGFGDSFNVPLRLDTPDEQQQDGLRAYRIEQENEFFFLWQRSYDGQWARQYRFTLEPRKLADFEPMCEYHQTSPESHFTQRGVCTLATENGRITLSDQKLITTEAGERQERSVDEYEYQGILASRFGVKLE